MGIKRKNEIMINKEAIFEMCQNGRRKQLIFTKKIEEMRWTKLKSYTKKKKERD